MKKKSFFGFKVVFLVGVVYMIYQLHSVIFNSELAKRYSHYIWYTLEDANLKTQRIVFFIFFLLFFGIVYLLFAVFNEFGKATVFTIIFILITQVFGNNFWHIFFLILFLPELCILGIIDLLRMAANFIHLYRIGNIFSFLLIIGQIVMVALTAFLGIGALYAPLSFLTDMAKESNNNNQSEKVYYRDNKEKDFLDEVRKDRIEEHLKNIESELKRKR